MLPGMVERSEKSERIRAAILRALIDCEGPCGASRIAGSVLSMGVQLQPRAIRYYLSGFDREGLTRLVSRRKGRVLTERGRLAAGQTDLTGHLGLMAAKIDTLAYRMSFDLEAGTGTVITNVSCVEPSLLSTVLDEIRLVVDGGLAVGRRIAIARAGETIGAVTVPERTIGIGTVCSITFNGIFQSHAVPVTSRFGGLLEIRRQQRVRFLNMIEYRGSTLDPLEVFVRADMTRVRDVVLRGSGVVCASFREIPAAAVPDLRTIVRKAEKHGLTGILEIGKPGQALFGIPVAGGYCGVVVAGGINAVAGAIERGVRVSFNTLTGLDDYSRFVSLQEAARIARA